MTWLFVRFYAGVLVVLFLAWFIHGTVLKRRADAETARVFVEAHGGGARLVASELNAASPESRAQVLASLRKRFDYALDVIPLSDLPSDLQRTITSGEDVAHYRLANRHCIVARLSPESNVVRLGPFPDYDLQEIEEALGGWMRLTADKLDAAGPAERRTALERLQGQFDFPVDLASRDDLPDWPKQRILGGADVVFYSEQPQPNERWYSAAPLANGKELVRFGPFPSFERIEQKAAATTLALVLLPAALAIALLLRPVARQLRQVEHAALAIAAGDLSARVDERRVRSAKPLAQAFNKMAGRTETLVRTQRELLQAVSHELRTPLSRMRFAVDLIETAEDDQQRKRRLESLEAATEELDELVGELLSYVRMETAEGQLERERIVLQEVFEELIPRQASLFPSIQFAVEHDDGGAIVVFAERSRLQRALGNLLSNAGRFATRRVAVSAESAAGTTVIYVDDDGSGVPVSERDRVFEPFVRLDNDSNGRGVGLGLALVRRIMTQHGGHVEVLTSPLGGCRVQTTWPACASKRQDTDGCQNK